jgi:transposase InsO family protein
MAQVIHIELASLERWISRRQIAPVPKPRGRPEVISSEARWKLRECYLKHHKQWGPRVLKEWAEREDLGSFSPTTIAKVTEDLRDEPEAKQPTVRYEITSPGVMWSEDGAGFKERGRKKELLVAQDECSRFKVNHKLVDGPAKAADVHDYLTAAFEAHGAPLFLKHDGGKIFHAEPVQGLLQKHGVIELTGPRYYPQYNGKKERSIRDIKSYERAMRKHGYKGSLAERLDAALHDLNEDRPRPVLGGRTAREVYEHDRVALPDRRLLMKEVDREEEKLLAAATCRAEVDKTRRRAVEHVLLVYGLMKEMGDVSTNYRVGSRTS